MYLIFTYNGELIQDIKNLSHRYDFIQGDLYEIELSKLVCESIYNEDFLTIKQIIRRLKMEKINKKSINNDYLFLDFYLNNFDKIFIMEKNDSN